ncbi:NAD(P)-binding protein [Marasmius fiardii PR-910]|nr:NAD(P)-binding protein [Marasmius fiardii PR-910]
MSMSTTKEAEPGTTAIHIPDDELVRNADRLKGKVVMITGAANGIGKETAVGMGSLGAKIVIGDLDISGAQKTAEEIRNAGGTAHALKCDVTTFDDVVALYDFTLKAFGCVDVVVANAGITENERIGDVKLDANGKPKPLGYKCIRVNLFGVLNTVHLAQHYLTRNRKDNNDLKAVVLLGSMASWLGIPSATQYTASKHAVLGVMRSMHPIYERLNIRIATIHPFFADTAIVSLPVKIFLTGIPLVPVPRIAKAITYAASNPDPATSGCAYLLPDGGEVFKIPKEEFKLGVYKVIDERANALFKAAGGATVPVKLVGKLKVPLLAVIIAAVSWAVYGKYGK